MHDLSHHAGSSLGAALSHRARFLRRGSAVLVTLLVLFGLSAAVAAAAGPLLKERFHDEGTFVDEDFCGAGFTVDGTFVTDGSVLVVPHGPDGLQYFLEHLKVTVVYTNRANGKTVTFEVTRVNKDLRVTDNGDGTLTILALATGNDVFYGPDGNVIGRNPGQVRVEILVDHGGTPTDPFDDEFLAQELVKGSTGRSDDFCEAAVPALS